jgi:hypothetical protein
MTAYQMTINDSVANDSVANDAQQANDRIAYYCFSTYPRKEDLSLAKIY